MRLLLVDDEPLALARLQALLGDFEDVEVVGLAQDGDEAAELIVSQKPDLVLLDIRMPNQSGMSLARSLGPERDVEIIFITAFDHFAAQAFEVDAVDYLLKPVEPARLKVALDRARRRRAAGVSAAHPQPEPAPTEEGASTPSVIWVPGRNGLTAVDVTTIQWVEAARDYVLLHTPLRSHMLRSTMEALQKQLDPATVVRVNRSALVRRSAIAAITRQGKSEQVVVLQDGTALRVGASYARGVAEIDAPA